MARKRVQIKVNLKPKHLLPNKNNVRKAAAFITREMIREVREQAARGDFGPNSSPGADSYSKTPYFFDTETPRGAKGKFDKYRGETRRTRSGRYVKLPGGYSEFRSIFRGEPEGGPVNLSLTGRMLRALKGKWRMAYSGEVEIRVEVEDTKRGGDRISNKRKAEIHNNEGTRSKNGRIVREFMYLPKEKYQEIVEKAFEMAGIPFRLIKRKIR